MLPIAPSIHKSSPFGAIISTNWIGTSTEAFSLLLIRVFSRDFCFDVSAVKTFSPDRCDKCAQTHAVCDFPWRKIHTFNSLSKTFNAVAQRTVHWKMIFGYLCPCCGGELLTCCSIQTIDHFYLIAEFDYYWIYGMDGDRFLSLFAHA